MALAALVPGMGAPRPCRRSRDVSSAAGGRGFATPAYATLADAGLDDAWRAARPDADGFTCCRAPGLAEATSSLDVRLDVVLYRGNLTVTEARLLGEQPRTIAGAVRWPSDHAGVLVTLELP